MITPHWGLGRTCCIFFVGRCPTLLISGFQGFGETRGRGVRRALPTLMITPFQGFGETRGRGIRRALPYANGLRPFRALGERRGGAAFVGRCPTLMDYALSGLCIAGIAAAALRGEAHAVRLYCTFAAIGYAELRFAPVPRRGIISIEKGYPFLANSP
ncbi:MAG: hypothetical protein LBB79_07640 [Prevotellaceae bacterium]|nr:hypothetical protein [Prevotellaceae bacterium]